MTMSTGWRKFALVVHVSSSVGWFGSVLSFLALALIGVVSQDDGLARAAYMMMEPVGWFVIVPLNLASLASGLVSSLATSWGLFQHYWVLAKLLINVVATVVLLMYMQTLGHLASVARQGPDGDAAVHRDPSPIVHTGAAVVLLLLALVLAVYKPRGVTGYGRRKRRVAGVDKARAGAVAPT